MNSGEPSMLNEKRLSLVQLSHGTFGVHGLDANAHPQPRWTRVCNARPNHPLTSVRARHAPDHHDTPISYILGRRIRIIPLRARLLHRPARVLEREEGRQRVGLPAPLQLLRARVLDAGRAEQPGRADPHVQPARRVQHVVDQRQRVGLGARVRRVGHHLRVGRCA